METIKKRPGHLRRQLSESYYPRAGHLKPQGGSKPQEVRGTETITKGNHKPLS